MRYILLVIALSFALFSFADGSTAQIHIERKGKPDNHGQYYIPADMPEVYYDSDNLEIILVADGFSSYYYVEIFQTEYTIPVISTQVDGYGDSIDISSLPDDDYTIIITSSNNNQYEGQFTNY